MLRSTREFVQMLKKEGELLVIDEPVNPHLELAEIQRHVVAQKGPALLFTNVLGTPFSVASNLYGSQKRMALAFGPRPEALIAQAAHLAQTLFPPTLSKIWGAKGLVREALRTGTKSVSGGSLLEAEIPGADATKLPGLVSWPEDGGPFITLPLVYTEHPQTHKSNLGMYRIQIFAPNTVGMHIQIHRGGGFHYHEAQKQGQALPAHIYVGGPPALTLAAVAPLPEDVPEILLASLLMGGRLGMARRPDLSPLPFLTDADFCVVGHVPPHERRPEGPFGDHYGYYSLKHDYPFLKVQHIFHRKDAIYPLTVVGRPPQEDHFIACYLQDLLKPLIHLVMPQVRQIWAYEESGVHALAAAIVKDRYPREALTTALRILGEGQLSLTKVLLVSDHEHEAKNFYEHFSAVLARCDFAKDIFVLSNISQDTLDYTGPAVNEGSKMIWLGLGETRRSLPEAFTGSLNDSRFGAVRVACPGALAVSGAAFKTGDSLAEVLATHSALVNWPVVFLFDDAVAATQSPEAFIWHAFTRFEPAADLVAAKMAAIRYHTALTPPLIFDCRLKSWYPKVLESDPVVVKKIDPLLRKYRL
jgi:UbiD family decarboxylase